MDLTTSNLLHFNYEQIINFVLGLPSETKQDLIANLQISLQATQKVEIEFWDILEKI